MNIEELVREQKLIELSILQQSLEDRDKRIWELERKVELLEGMLNRVSAFQGGMPQPQPMPAVKSTPRRWAV
jgi:hypothetical protein